MCDDLTVRPAEKIKDEPTGPFTFEKLFGVSLLGAVTGVFLYYVYHQLSEDTKKVVKESIISSIKSQLSLIHI